MRLNTANMWLLLAFSSLPMAAVTAAELDLAADRPLLNAEGLKYVHSVEKARFTPDTAMKRDAQGVYVRTYGDKAVFMEDTVTGATLLVPNAPAAGPKSAALKAELPQFLTDQPDKHSAEVKAYLLGAGIPVSEVSGTHVTTTMAGGGPVNAGIQPTESKLLWYTTHLERSLNGIPVEGSFAFAALDSKGRSITEGVYWPAISAQVVRQAVALKRKLSNGDALRQFLGQAKAARPDAAAAEAGEVKIVHTSAGHHGAFEAKAVYSVIVRNSGHGKAQIVRFDETGSPVVLADEVKLMAKDSPKAK